MFWLTYLSLCSNCWFGCLLHQLLDVIILVIISSGGLSDPQWIHWGVGTRKAMPVNFLFSSGMTWHSLGSTSGCRNDFLGSTMTITPQLSRGGIHSLLSGSDGMDHSYEPFHEAKVVLGDLVGGVLNSWWVVQDTLLTILSDLSCFLWLTPITNMGASAEGAEMMTLLAPPFKWALAFSMVAKMPVDSTT